jgi:hypothetical protein
VGYKGAEVIREKDPAPLRTLVSNNEILPTSVHSSKFYAILSVGITGVYHHSWLSKNLN